MQTVWKPLRAPFHRGCCVADKAVEHGLACPSAHTSRLLWRAPGCHTPRNGTKRLLLWLRFAACNLHCMRGALLHLFPCAGSSSQVLLLLISPSKCSLLFPPVLDVDLIHRHFTLSPAAQAKRWGEQKLFIHVCQEINFAEASKCMLGEWCKQGVVACGLL